MTNLKISPGENPKPLHNAKLYVFFLLWAPPPLPPPPTTKKTPLFGLLQPCKWQFTITETILKNEKHISVLLFLYIYILKEHTKNVSTFPRLFGLRALALSWNK